MHLPIKKYIPISIRRKLAAYKHKPVVARFLGRFSITGSQAGQDYWVIYEAFNEMKQGFFVDLGAYDGIHMSNTYKLERIHDWSGICIEANPETYLKLRLNRSSQCFNVCIDKNSAVVDFRMNEGRSGICADDDTNSKTDNSAERHRLIKLETCRFEEILLKAKAPSEIDYLSLDVEGAEENIFHSFPFDRYKFRTMTIERPSTQLRTLLADNGYSIVREVPNLDAFFVHESFIKEYKKNLFEFYGTKQLLRRWK